MASPKLSYIHTWYIQRRCIHTYIVNAYIYTQLRHRRDIQVWTYSSHSQLIISINQQLRCWLLDLRTRFFQFFGESTNHIILWFNCNCKVLSNNRHLVMELKLNSKPVFTIHFCIFLRPFVIIIVQQFSVGYKHA